MNTLIALSGASATGKTTAAKRLALNPSVSRVVTTTTREQRDGESDKDYRFVSQAEFAELARSGEMLEWVAFCGHLYGVARAALEASFRQASTAVVVCTPHALQKLARWSAERSVVFRSVYLATDLEILQQRLSQRRSPSCHSDSLRLRALGVQASWFHMHEYDCVVTNATIDQVLTELQSLIAA